MKTRGALCSLGSHFIDIGPTVVTTDHIQDTSKGLFGFSWTSTVCLKTLGNSN